MDTHRWLERLASADDDAPRPCAPARLKSRVYSALVRRLEEEAPLQPLRDTKACGGRLCVFEEILAALPAGAGQVNPCRVCHARLLAERLERAPIYWPGCPYAEFHKR